MTKLTYKQQTFVSEYIVTFNATQAAIKAGYSKKTARQIGYRLLTNVYIKNLINQELIKLHDCQRHVLFVASEKAINALIDEVTNGRGRSRISAANSILDRVGFNFNNSIYHEINHTAQVGNEVKKDEAINRFLDELNRKHEIYANSSDV